MVVLMHKRILVRYLLLVSLIMMRSGCADSVMILPSFLTEIGDNAFMGCDDINEVELPYGLKSIGDRAFASCSSLQKVHIPATVSSFGADAFQDSAEALLIECDLKSPAQKYALAKNIDFDADTDCRALLIGQTNYPTGHALTAPQYDVRSMEAALTQNGARSYEVTVLEDLTPSEMLSGISDVFSEADEGDISLFYYAGHGLSSPVESRNGALVGIEYYSSYLFAADLRAALDQIPGRKIVIIDACHSGALIGRGEKGTETGYADPSVSFMKAFLKGDSKLLSRGNSFESNLYYVITASKGSEYSYEDPRGEKVYGLLSNAICLGCGYNCVTEQYINKQADINEDGILTLKEVYDYALNKIHEVTEEENVEQTAQVYPENCSWFGLMR